MTSCKLIRFCQPFPSNPRFQPRPPLTDAVRQEIYDTFTLDPADWSIRKLATKFNISMRRVEAVLKLKEAEKELEMNVSDILFPSAIWIGFNYSELGRASSKKIREGNGEAHGRRSIVQAVG